MALSILKPNRKKTSAERLRRSAVRGRQAGRILSGGAVLLRMLLPVLLGCSACYYLVTADALAIRTVRCTGCDLIDCEKIAERAGIVPGRNIFFADVGRTTRLLEDDPWIHRALVKRTLPDTIEIQVEERRPAAVLELDRPCLIDTYGDVFYCPERYEAGLPAIAGLTREYIMGNPEQSASLVGSALDLIRGMQRHNMVRQSPRVSIEPLLGMTIEDNGTRIFMGLDNYSDKLRLLEFVQGDLAMKNLSAASIHIGSARQAAVSLRQAESPAGTRRKAGALANQTYSFQKG